MDIEVIKVAATFGSSTLLLALVLVYIGKYYIPEQLKAHRQDVESILSSHSKDFGGVAKSVDGLERQMRNHSRVSLIQTLIAAGMPVPDAEREALRIITNGNGGG